MTADQALAIITRRGLDAATNPVAQSGRGSTRLAWLGPTAPDTTTAQER